jgi:hypothetical protein
MQTDLAHYKMTLTTGKERTVLKYKGFALLELHLGSPNKPAEVMNIDMMSAGELCSVWMVVEAKKSSCVVYGWWWR